MFIFLYQEAATEFSASCDEISGALRHQSPAGGLLESSSNVTRLASISVLLFFFAPVSSFSHLLCVFFRRCSDARAGTTSLGSFSFGFEHLYHRMFPFLFQMNIFCGMKVLLCSLI